MVRNRATGRVGNTLESGALMFVVNPAKISSSILPPPIPRTFKSFNQRTELGEPELEIFDGISVNLTNSSPSRLLRDYRDVK